MQLNLPLNTWGGKRKGAGRPPQRYRSSEEHAPRERFDRLTAFHVTLRTVDDLGNLRTPVSYHAVREALDAVRTRPDFGIVQLSIQTNHIHSIVEADNDSALAKGMQAFQVSSARRINRALHRTGQVFGDRYHPVEISSPTQALYELNYVLNNWRRHKRDVGQDWSVDYYSSGPSFDGWRETFTLPAHYRPLPVKRARTWLLNVGWRKASDQLSCRAVPGG